MRLSTPRFGELEVKEEDMIVFPSGILGFEDVHRYVLLEHSDDSVFHILQGVDDPAVAFVLIDPRTFRPDYQAEIDRSKSRLLELDDEDDAVVLAIVTVPAGDPAGMTANLQAPVRPQRPTSGWDAKWSWRTVRTACATPFWRNCKPRPKAKVRAGRAAQPAPMTWPALPTKPRPPGPRTAGAATKRLVEHVQDRQRFRSPGEKGQRGRASREGLVPCWY